MTPIEVIEDLEPTIGPNRLLVIGEIPGTNELPQLVADLAALSLSAGHRTFVGLEVPFTEPLDGEHWGPFWTRDPRYADGRSSRAMAELVTALADLRADGAPLTTVGLDGAWVAPGSEIPLQSLADLERPRDEAMAGHLLAAMNDDARATAIALVGAEHSGVGRGSGSFGSIVAPWFDPAVSLLAVATGGTTLALGADGPEVRPLDNPVSLDRGAVWSEAAGADGHHGFVNVGSVSASEPFPA